MDTANVSGTGLERLNSAVAQDLKMLMRPAANWVPPRIVSGERVCDVVIIGGGMCGLLVHFALTSGGMRNIRILDKAPEGFEGPWVTYARMETLRSPKHLVGPAFGMASLTFRAWFTAQFGEPSWDRLDKIPRTMWMDYLRWYKKVLSIPVESEVSVDTIAPEGDLVRLTLSGPGACEPSILARKVVMATGRDGLGYPTIPRFVADLPRRYWAHSSDDIDFAPLKGKRVAIVGVGASAVENGAEAAEAGAAQVRFLIRRHEMPTINKMMGIGSFGFTSGYADLSDAWRWRFMHYSFVTQTPAPRGSTLRASRHPSVSFHFGKSIETVTERSGAASIVMADGSHYDADYLILGTGFTVDPLARDELEGAADKILLWRDVYMPPADERHGDLENFPYLSADFSFKSRDHATAPFLSNIHAFNYGATVSLGKVSGDIPGVSDGAAWLARALAANLYREDVDVHYQALKDYAKPELQGDEWTPSPWPDDETTADLPRIRAAE
ncbi:MAG: NAD(P)/FAD-dependent oxidoreductase [Pseudomonadota bacterium]